MNAPDKDSKEFNLYLVLSYIFRHADYPNEWLGNFALGIDKFMSQKGIINDIGIKDDKGLGKQREALEEFILGRKAVKSTDSRFRHVEDQDYVNRHARDDLEISSDGSVIGLRIRNVNRERSRRAISIILHDNPKLFELAKAMHEDAMHAWNKNRPEAFAKALLKHLDEFPKKLGSEWILVKPMAARQVESLDQEEKAMKEGEAAKRPGECTWAGSLPPFGSLNQRIYSFVYGDLYAINPQVKRKSPVNPTGR